MRRFRAHSPLDSGGFGQVDLVHCDPGGQIYARKMLLDDNQPESVARFRREVQALLQLDHPNIVKVVATRLRAPPYFFVMPYYPATLLTLLSNGDLSKGDKLILAGGILDGLEYAHESGTLHRDLKPSNVLVDPDTLQVALSDFGHCRRSDLESLTRSGDLIGTLLYMSPEQLRDAKSVDERSDIFSVGRVLIELFGGTLETGKPPSPTQLAVVTSRATAERAEARFQSVNELRDAFERSLSAEVAPIGDLLDSLRSRRLERATSQDLFEFVLDIAVVGSGSGAAAASVLNAQDGMVLGRLAASWGAELCIATASIEPSLLCRELRRLRSDLLGAD